MHQICVCVCVFGFYIQTYPNPKTIWQPVNFLPNLPKILNHLVHQALSSCTTFIRRLGPGIHGEDQQTLLRFNVASTCPAGWPLSKSPCFFRGPKDLMSCEPVVWGNLPEASCHKKEKRHQKHLVDLKTQGIGPGR